MREFNVTFAETCVQKTRNPLIDSPAHCSEAVMKKDAVTIWLPATQKQYYISNVHDKECSSKDAKHIANSN